MVYDSVCQYSRELTPGIEKPHHSITIIPPFWGGYKNRCEQEVINTEISETAEVKKGFRPWAEELPGKRGR